MWKKQSRSINFYINLFRQLQGLIVVMDKQSRFIYSNDYTARMFGYSNESNMLGVDPYAMRCPAVESAKDFVRQNQLVMQNNNELTMLDIHKYADSHTKILLTKKTPYYENNQLSGVICQCNELKAKTLSQICSALIQSDIKYYSTSSKFERSYMIGLNQKDCLSEREMDCVFYLLRGNTAKQIAQQLQNSPRTIESLIENIKLKLNCTTKSEIIECCLVKGYLNYIPKNILSQNITAILE